MDRQRIAFVLRSYIPEKHKLVVFDREHGCQELVVKAQGRYVQGGLLEYTLSHHPGHLFVQSSSLIALPSMWVLEDLIFLHTVLEILLFFVPLCSNPHGLFEHVIKLFDEPPHVPLDLYKKLFICRIFSLLGIYPEHEERFDEKFLYLISAPIDIMLSVQECLVLQRIDLWIRGCVATHPLQNSMKVAFIARVENHESS